MVTEDLTIESVQWWFNPPSAPLFGGVWETTAKVVKYLRRVIGETTLTFKEMVTFLAEIEAYLNSKLFQALTNDPEDLKIYFPGHFFFATSLNPVLNDVPTA